MQHGARTDGYMYARTLHGPDQICTDCARIRTDVHGRTDAARTLHGYFMVPVYGASITKVLRGRVDGVIILMKGYTSDSSTDTLYAGVRLRTKDSAEMRRKRWLGTPR